MSEEGINSCPAITLRPYKEREHDSHLCYK